MEYGFIHLSTFDLRLSTYFKTHLVRSHPGRVDGRG